MTTCDFKGVGKRQEGRQGPGILSVSAWPKFRVIKMTFPMRPSRVRLEEFPNGWNHGVGVLSGLSEGCNADGGAAWQFHPQMPVNLKVVNAHRPGLTASQQQCVDQKKYYVNAELSLR